MDVVGLVTTVRRMKMLTEDMGTGRKRKGKRGDHVGRWERVEGAAVAWGKEARNPLLCAKLPG